jgi:hypothetical protein
MLETIRSILSGMYSVRTRGQKALRVAGQVVFFLYFALFISDCINIDVLFATVKGGAISFVDNPEISDSLFDTGNVHHVSVFDAPSHQNQNQKFSQRSSKPSGNLVKNVIYEDEDSPGIEDAMLSSSFAAQGELPRPESEFQTDHTVQTLDRTISYQRILI